MKGVSIITHPDFGEVRNLIINGDPWFVAKDLCDILGLKNSRDILAKCLDEDEKGVDTIYTPGGNQQITIINESGLYSLIFQSRKPDAKKFRKWVTSEVLPSIRRTGYYVNPHTVMSRRDRNMMQKQFYKELERNITGEDIYKLSRRYRCSEGRVTTVLRGGMTDIHLMRELQECALDNRANRVDVYSDAHICKILDALK